MLLKSGLLQGSGVPLSVGHRDGGVSDSPAISLAGLTVARPCWTPTSFLKPSRNAARYWSGSAPVNRRERATTLRLPRVATPRCRRRTGWPSYGTTSGSGGLPARAPHADGYRGRPGPSRRASQRLSSSPSLHRQRTPCGARRHAPRRRRRLNDQTPGRDRRGCPARAGLAAGCAAQEHPVAEATLTGGAEVPGPGDPDGTGTAHVVLYPDQGRSVSGSPSTTSPFRHPRPHPPGASGIAGPVVVQLPPGADSNSAGCVTGVPRNLIQAIISNPSAYYVNVHNAYPAGRPGPAA